jgi:two-component system CheB/CheR fusion protein
MATAKGNAPRERKASARTGQKQAAAVLQDPVAPAPAPKGENERNKSAGTVRAFYVVGIGASAGGLEALREFFGNTPPDSGIAYIVVSHLAPDHKSIMGQLLQKSTKLPVVEAEEAMQVRPNHVYVIPPAKEMSILGGQIQLLDPAPNKEVRYPIDFFFRSLAQDQGERAIAVVLSGTGTDGTRGIKDIKTEGGLVIVQDSQDAQYTGMPLSAVETGLADYVLPARKMPKTIVDYVRHTLALRLKNIQRGDAQEGDQLSKVFVLIRNEVGLDFSLYKRDHLLRGIQKQMSMHRIETLEEYVRLLRVNAEEVARLARALLIKVTRFFRDGFAFETLKRKGLPALTKGKDKKTPLRVWVPGCATGEEAYSIAMILREYMEETGNRFAIQIFATDVDSKLVEFGRNGLYPVGITEDVSPERLDRFFDKVGPKYKVKDDLRSLVIFAAQDLVKGPTFTRLDLISCRNVLIYMGAQLQKRIVPLFHYCLNPGGILFLGTSETIGGFIDVFSTLDNKARIFQAKRVKSPALPKSMRTVQIPEMPR